MRFEVQRKASESIVANTLASIFRIRKSGCLSTTLDTLLDEGCLPLECSLYTWESDVWEFLVKPKLESSDLGQHLYLNEDIPFIVRDRIQGGKDSLWYMVITETPESMTEQFKRFTPLIVTNYAKTDEGSIAVVGIKIETLCDTNQGR